MVQGMGQKVPEFTHGAILSLQAQIHLPTMDRDQPGETDFGVTKVSRHCKSQNFAFEKDTLVY